ncbi:G patch domain-containing protein 11 [Oryza brachyantha]|uniref:G patch domain-containing protein 11 n=1 Tax=Oryza brachyantha TaxID=4533 RepID=UPI001ADC2A30|nr:G patch domain-containing protein 11 [Oryza brachyantha]
MEPDGGGDDDDDYMGDLSHFLPPSPSSPSRSLGRRKQPPAAQAQARGQGQGQGQGKRAKGVPWQERRRRDRERKQREEDERTMAGLAEAIPESNVGFRLLKQMGYDPAAAGGGAAEPVGIEIRRSRAGLGAEPAVAVAPPPPPRQPSAEVAEGERRRVEEMAVELRARQSTQWRSRRVVRDYRKAEAALAQLENREVAPPPPEGEEKEKTAEEEEVITEEDLQNILAKLRGEHYYCLYCGCKYESAEALANECPGPNEDEH